MSDKRHIRESWPNATTDGSGASKQFMADFREAMIRGEREWTDLCELMAATEGIGTVVRWDGWFTSGVNRAELVMVDHTRPVLQFDERVAVVHHLKKDPFIYSVVAMEAAFPHVGMGPNKYILAGPENPDPELHPWAFHKCVECGVALCKITHAVFHDGHRPRCAQHWKQYRRDQWLYGGVALTLILFLGVMIVLAITGDRP